MRTISLNHEHTNLLHALHLAAKFILPVLLLIYAIFHFSIQQWILLGLFTVCAMAIVSRFTTAVATPKSSHTVKHGNVCSDGGTFRHVEQPQQGNARPVVHDGGSFERSSTVSRS